MNWHEFIRTLAAIVTASVAYTALRNWQRQDKAKREVAFLDELMEAVQTYTHNLSPLIATVTVTRIGIYGSDGPHDEVSDADAIRDFIKADRGMTFASIEKELEPLRNAALKLDALVKKGDVFRFESYEKCRAAISEMTQVLNLVEVIAGTLGSTHRNPNNPRVRIEYESCAKIIKLNLRTQNKAGNEKFLAFVTGAFQRIYG